MEHHVEKKCLKENNITSKESALKRNMSKKSKRKSALKGNNSPVKGNNTSKKSSLTRNNMSEKIKKKSAFIQGQQQVEKK